MRVLTDKEAIDSWLSGLGTAGPDSREAELVAGIIADVRQEGDAAVRRWSSRFDRSVPQQLRVAGEVLEQAHARLDPELLAAIRLSISRVRNYYAQQLEPGFSFSEGDARLGMLVRPLSSVGCYIPGGQAPLFSTLIMTAVPAQVAGVDRITLASPPGPDGLPHETVLATAHELGISEVWAMGGAQAIAALALGTGSVRPVDKIVGPGNRFVMMAKQQLFGTVGIESLPGPTETLVLADASADPEHVIADLLAQAEHSGAVPVLVTDSAALLDQVLTGLPVALADLPAAEVARESLAERGTAVLVPDLQAGMAVANDFAPEHLCLLVAEPEALIDQVRNAGGIFVGHSTMEALGDYIAGPSHVMPTGRTARFASFVNVRDFQKVIPVLQSSSGLTASIGPAAVKMARAEGLEAHARAILSRMGNGG